MNKFGYKTGKKFEVIKATRKPISGISLDDKKFKFGKNGGFYVNDAGVAAEIEKTYGHKKGNGDVVISPIEFVDNEGHQNFFPVRGATWRKKRWIPSEDPDWEEVRPGVYREVRRNPKRNARRVADGGGGSEKEMSDG